MRGISSCSRNAESSTASTSGLFRSIANAERKSPSAKAPSKTQLISSKDPVFFSKWPNQFVFKEY